MYGKFFENKLKTLLVKGNGQAIKYNWNDKGVLETITKQLCSNIEFELTDNEIDQIKCLKQTDGKTYPPSLFPENDKKLKGFIWREDEQPLKKEDIFIKDGKPKRVPLAKKIPVKAATPKKDLTKKAPDKKGVKKKGTKPNP